MKGEPFPNKPAFSEHGPSQQHLFISCYGRTPPPQVQEEIVLPLGNKSTQTHSQSWGKHFTTLWDSVCGSKIQAELGWRWLDSPPGLLLEALARKNV